MTIEQLYRQQGGDYEDALRLFGSQEIMIKYMRRLAQDSYYVRLKNAVESGDMKESFELAHTLKGNISNYMFGELEELISNLVEQLRPQTEKADEKIWGELSEHYENLLMSIAELEN